MEKQRITREIQRLAEANGGIPPGARTFSEVTGIKQNQWRGEYWARWSDALREAGLQPNVPAPRLGEDLLLSRAAELTRRLSRMPTWAEVRLEHRRDPTFPSDSTYRRALLGKSSALAAALRDYCEDREDLQDVLRLLPANMATLGHPVDAHRQSGTVYLLKAGRHFKIGRAFVIGRRLRDIALQLPERAVMIHSIETDDPVGIEGYWHKRFGDRRKNGEWFDLTDADVRAFKRRKRFM